MANVMNIIFYSLNISVIHHIVFIYHSLVFEPVLLSIYIQLIVYHIITRVQHLYAFGITIYLQIKLIMFAKRTKATSFLYKQHSISFTVLENLFTFLNFELIHLWWLSHVHELLPSNYQ